MIDNLLHNPWVQPPSAEDWQVQPTCPRHGTVPYYLAPLWDTHFAKLDKNKGSGKGKKRGKKGKRGMIDANEPHESPVPKELRLRLKHARAARGMLRDIEDTIRAFLLRHNDKQTMLREEGLADAPSVLSDEDDDWVDGQMGASMSEASVRSGEGVWSDDTDDEVVFVGRSGQMSDLSNRREQLRQMNRGLKVGDGDVGRAIDRHQYNQKAPHAAQVNGGHQLDGHQLVFDSPASDGSAGFGCVSTPVLLLPSMRNDCLLTVMACTAAGSFIRLPATMACSPGLSPLVGVHSNLRGARRMWESGRGQRPQ